MSDALKSGAVDAVLTVEPFVSRIKAAGIGDVATRYAAELARTDPIISYVSTRAFAEKNPDAIKAFRASIEEAAPIVNSDREKAIRGDREVHQDADRHRAAEQPAFSRRRS